MESYQNIASKYISSNAAGGIEESKESHQEDPFGLKSLGSEDQTKPTLRSFKIKSSIVSKALENFFTYTQYCQRYEGDIQELHQQWGHQLVQLKLKVNNIEDEGRLQELEDFDKEINLMKKEMSNQDIFAKFKDESYWRLLEEEVVANINLEDKSSSLQQRVHPKPALDRLSFSSTEFDSYYWLQKGCQRPFRSVIQLILWMNRPGDMNVTKGLDKRLPDLGELWLRNIPSESQEARDCVAKYFPKKVQLFSFNYESALGSIDLYHSALLAATSSVTETVFLYNFKISQAQTIALLAAFRKVTIFGLCSCIMHIPSVPSFPDSMANSNIWQLDFSSSGDRAHGDWGEDSSCFSNLMAGLAQVDILGETWSG
ncbi:unnamed protein product [Moneuplotes crassus]|uniref:Uncharacterized protein n=1 Tax=Euplotes crassus TaxID=5936 RepID=A0AAD1UN80_EUPCR|nr:unnamed protein product [Moneuplotes crassus]